MRKFLLGGAFLIALISFLYFLISLFFPARVGFKPIAQLGCLGISHTENHYVAITQRLKELQQRSLQPIYFRKNLNDFDKQVTSSALELDRFMIKIGSQGQDKISKAKSISVAYKMGYSEYSSCYQKIDSDRAALCEDNYKFYESNRQKLTQIQSELQIDINQHASLVERIVSSKPTQGSGGFDQSHKKCADAINNLIDGQRIEINAINQQIDKIKKHLNEEEIEKNKLITQESEKRVQLESLKNTLRICTSNLEEFGKCEEIRKTVSRLGISSLAELSNMVKSKKSIIEQMKRNFKLISCTRAEEYKINLIATENDLGALIKIYLEVTHDYNNKCSCSEQKKKQLQGSIDETERIIKRTTSEIEIIRNRVSSKRSQIEVLINKIEKVKERYARLIAEQKIKCQETPASPALDHELIILIEQLEAITIRTSSKRAQITKLLDTNSRLLKELNEIFYDIIKRKECSMKLEAVKQLKKQLGSGEKIAWNTVALSKSLSQIRL